MGLQRSKLSRSKNFSWGLLRGLEEQAKLWIGRAEGRNISYGFSGKKSPYWGIIRIMYWELKISSDAFRKNFES